METKKDFRPIISESVRLLQSEPCAWVTWPFPLLRLKLMPVPDINDVGSILLCSWKGRFVIGQYIDKYGPQITCTHFVDGWLGPDTVRYDKELALVKAYRRSPDLDYSKVCKFSALLETENQTHVNN